MQRSLRPKRGLEPSAAHGEATSSMLQQRQQQQHRERSRLDAPPLSLGTDAPVAVHLYDLDMVFLSKTVASLSDTVTRLEPNSFRIDPRPHLCESRRARAGGAVADDPNGTPLDGAAEAPAKEIGSAASILPSNGAKHESSSARRPTGSPITTRITLSDMEMHPEMYSGGTFAGSRRAHSPSRILFAPIDAYHAMISFRNTALMCDVPRQESHGGAGGCPATAPAERTSVAMPDRPPPRSGIAVVLRCEGEQRDGGASQGNGEAVSTRSRVARGLPLDAFDGWVRDHTVYGLACNAAPLRAAWTDKVSERLDVGVGDWSHLQQPGEEADLSPLTVHSHDGTHRGVSEEGEGLPFVANKAHADGISLSGEPLKEDAERAPSCTSSGEKGDQSCSPSILGQENHQSTKEDTMSSRTHSAEQPQCEDTPEGAAAAAVAVDVPPLAGTEFTSVERMISCSTTTASLSTVSSSSSRAQIDVVAEGEEHVERKAGSSVAAAVAQGQDNLPSHEQQQQLLWEEERRRTGKVAAQLRHRFIVSDSAQHAIWALEVRLPSMEVRVVSPAEFYDETSHRGSTAAPVEVREVGVADTPAESALPRKKGTPVHPRVTPTGRWDASAVAVVPITAASQPRSPSPTEPSPARISGSLLRPGVSDNERSSPNGTGALHEVPSPATTQPPHTSRSATRRTDRSDEDRNGGSHSHRSSTSASPSVMLAEAVPTPLLGGARGFVDGHFSIARFNSPGALCWRVDEDEVQDAEEDDGGDSDGGRLGYALHLAEEGKKHGRQTWSPHGRGDGRTLSTVRLADDPLTHLRRRRQCAVLFISDHGNCAIRYANFHNRLVRTITGMDGVPGYRDGSCVASLLRRATSMAWCSAGLLFTDGPNNVVRLITHLRKPQRQALETENAVDADILPTTTAEDEVPPKEKESQPSVAAHPDACKTPSPEGAAVSSWTRSASATAMPRVWTLAGCASLSRTAAGDPEREAGAARCQSSYIDSSAPSRACFGYLSDMALLTDETGEAQLLLVDQTHHALRIVETNGVVSTYVGSMDYEDMGVVGGRAAAGQMPEEDARTPPPGQAASGLPCSAPTALPPGLFFPCSLTLGALVKERAPALLSRGAVGGVERTMITPQPYLYSSSPVLFVASAVTGVVSELLPVSQQSVQTPWNTLRGQQHGAGADAATISRAAEGRAAVLAAIHGALELGLATEGRRTIGEAATPSLKRVVVGWGTVDEELDPDGKGLPRATHRVMQAARAQEALQYLRLRFPWLLPPAIPQLSARLIAGCCCYVSGKRHGSLLPAAPVALYSTGGLQHPNDMLPWKNSVETLDNTSAVCPTPSPQLLFHTPPRYPTIPSMTRHMPTASPAATLLREPGVLPSAPASMAADVLPHPQLGAGDGSVPRCHRDPLVHDTGVPRQGSETPTATSPVRSHHGSNNGTDEEEASHGGTDTSPAVDQPTDDADDADGQSGLPDDVGGASTVRRKKWLSPPAKSVSRSLGNSPSIGEAIPPPQQQQPQMQPMPLPSSSTYAGHFSVWPAEQRQQRLRSTFEIDLQPSPSESPQVPMESSPPPKRTAVAVPSVRNGRSGEHATLSSPHSSSSPSQPPPAAFSSRSSSISVGSPPLTPRAMAAHRLMHSNPRRSSRSSTAPQTAASMEGGRGHSASASAGLRSRSEASPPLLQQQRRQTSKPCELSVKSVARATSPCSSSSSAVADDSLKHATTPHRQPTSDVHHAYDVAVRQLFFLYDYLASKSITSAVVNQRGTTGAEGNAVPAAAAHRDAQSSLGAVVSNWKVGVPRQRVQYRLTFLAFFRFLVLTGYMDELASWVMEHGGVSTGNAPAANAVAPRIPLHSLCQVQSSKRARGSRSVGQGQRRHGVASGLVSSPFSAIPSASGDVRTLPSGNPVLAPLATADPRAIATALYACGVREQGYHIVTQMDFQSFRRAVLLLHTWHRTAQGMRQHRSTVKPTPKAAALTTAAAHDDGSVAAAFAYADVTPSLDSLTTEEVLRAYRETYERALRRIPALTDLLNSKPTPPLAQQLLLQKGSEELPEPQGDDGRTAANASAEPTLDATADGEAMNTPPVSPIRTTVVATDADVSSMLTDDHEVLPSAAWQESGAVLHPHEALALDDLLRLLQSNETSLWQLFTAYSVRITVHRSLHYEAPPSAAAAAAISHPCSLLLANHLDLSQAQGDAKKKEKCVTPALVRRASPTSSMAAQPRSSHATPRVDGSPAHVTAAHTRGPSTEAAALLRCISDTQQDLWWKVQQLYTMSAMENREVYGRSSHVLPMVPFKNFLELWRMLDVFPSLVNLATLQQAYLDALTIPMLRGTRETATAPRESPEATPVPTGGRSGSTSELLCAHANLPFLAFVESFVRVALTVFSHTPDRVAYPTSAAKTAGLMQWCNQQVSLGLVAQRVLQRQQQRSGGVATTHGAGRRVSLRMTTLSDAPPFPTNSLPLALNTTALNPTTHPATVGSMCFPVDLRLFRIPSTYP